MLRRRASTAEFAAAIAARACGGRGAWPFRQRSTTVRRWHQLVLVEFGLDRVTLVILRLLLLRATATGRRRRRRRHQILGAMIESRLLTARVPGVAARVSMRGLVSHSTTRHRDLTGRSSRRIFTRLAHLRLLLLLRRQRRRRGLRLLRSPVFLGQRFGVSARIAAAAAVRRRIAAFV